MAKFILEFRKVSQFESGSETRHVKKETDEVGVLQLLNDVAADGALGVTDLQLLSIRRKVEPKPKPAKPEMKK